jgi:hypothetical protein
MAELESLRKKKDNVERLILAEEEAVRNKGPVEDTKAYKAWSSQIEVVSIQTKAEINKIEQKLESLSNDERSQIDRVEEDIRAFREKEEWKMEEYIRTFREKVERQIEEYANKKKRDIENIKQKTETMETTLRNKISNIQQTADSKINGLAHMIDDYSKNTLIPTSATYNKNKSMVATYENQIAEKTQAWNEYADAQMEKKRQRWKEERIAEEQRIKREEEAERRRLLEETRLAREREEERLTRNEKARLVQAPPAVKRPFANENIVTLTKEEMLAIDRDTIPDNLKEAWDGQWDDLNAD